jgi:hypothetical protein
MLCAAADGKVVVLGERKEQKPGASQPREPLCVLAMRNSGRKEAGAEMCSVQCAVCRAATEKDVDRTTQISRPPQYWGEACSFGLQHVKRLGTRPERAGSHTLADGAPMALMMVLTGLLLRRIVPSSFRSTASWMPTAWTSLDTSPSTYLRLRQHKRPGPTGTRHLASSLVSL